jgi:hypothetical protein
MQVSGQLQAVQPPPRGKSHRCPLNGKLFGLQSWAGPCADNENLFAPALSLAPDGPAGCLVTVLTDLYAVGPPNLFLLWAQKC